MKKALLIGINKFNIPNSNLRGCINDVLGMHELLTQTYKFPVEQVRLLTDERATMSNILQRLDWLVANVTSGDELVLHVSSHGSQIMDRNGDELRDGLDELIVTHDHDWGRPLTDDMLKDRLSRLAPGVRFVMICDSCHSGTMTDQIPIRLGEGKEKPVNLVKRKKRKKLKVQERYLEPPLDIKARSMSRSVTSNRFGRKQSGGIPQGHILLSGCRDDQTSADAYIEGKWQGALTASLLKVLRTNYNMTWEDAQSAVIKLLKRSGFTQRPQLSGNYELVTRPVFGGR